MNTSVQPGDWIGIVGAGQLGRMLALAAAPLGLFVRVYAPEPGPAFDVCADAVIGGFDDDAALLAFAGSCAAVTYEFENIPTPCVERLAERTPVRPGVEALARTQDRLLEKQFLNGLGIPTAPWRQVDDSGSLARAVAQLGRHTILKTRRFGYDGKGQTMVREGADLATLFRSLGGAPAILEGVVPFTREISVVAARGLDGAFVAWDVCENHHEHHILSVTRAPAAISPATAARAVDITRTIAEALDYVGVIAVEMFVVDGPNGEEAVVNEIAPRVHNSGHWTIDGAVTSQFEQHVRAVCGWPLGDTRRLGVIEMRNLLGDDIEIWRDVLAAPGSHLHLYAKAEARPGRKMGHVTKVVLPD